jgi:hypothetical protein
MTRLDPEEQMPGFWLPVATFYNCFLLPYAFMRVVRSRSAQNKAIPGDHLVFCQKVCLSAECNCKDKQKRVGLGAGAGAGWRPLQWPPGSRESPSWSALSKGLRFFAYSIKICCASF